MNANDMIFNKTNGKITAGGMEYKFGFIAK